MPTERRSPLAILEIANLTDNVALIQDDPDSPDGNWMLAASNNAASIVRVSHAAPSGTLSGNQEFRALVRKMGGTGTPQARIELWEAGSLVRAGANVNVSTTAGVVLSFTWTPDEIAAAGGTDVELRIYGTQSGGNTNARAAIEVGAAEWNVAYVEAAPPVSFTPASAYHEQDAGSALLVQTHLFSAAAGIHDQTSTSPVLAQAHSFTAADAWHEQAASSPVLSLDAPAVLITAESCTHEQYTSSPLLAQTHIFTAHDAYHEQICSSSVLGQAYVFTTSDAIHDQVASSPTLGGDAPVAYITPAPCIHEQVSGSPALSQTHTIVSADSWHDQVANSPVLLQLHLFAASDGVQLQLATEPALTERGTIEGPGSRPVYYSRPRRIISANKRGTYGD